jgi:lipoate-protein ligase A
MQLLDLTLPTPQENLACDEALLELCEEHACGEVLRFWEPQQHFVVLGYSNKAATELDADACRERGVPILRRCTGGGTVVQGPGCLNYSLVLRFDATGPLRNVSEANCFIMRRHRDALQPLLATQIEVAGHTDLATAGWKFSGNSQRRARRCLLFHGSFLLRLDLGLIEALLPVPQRQPSYRRNRSHETFLRNLNLPAGRVKEALREAWQANEPSPGLPTERVARLVAEKYSCADWNFKF